MSEINSGGVILYIDGKPIACSGVTLTLPFMSCTDSTEMFTGQEYTFTCEGLVDKEWTFEDHWNYNYYMAKHLPRKQKKAYRKKLVKMLLPVEDIKNGK